MDAVAAAHGLRAADPSTGVSLELGQGAWGLVRRSATEPVLRVTVEAPDDATADALHGHLLSSIAGAVGR